MDNMIESKSRTAKSRLGLSLPDLEGASTICNTTDTKLSKSARGLPSKKLPTRPASNSPFKVDNFERWKALLSNDECDTFAIHRIIYIRSCYMAFPSCGSKLPDFRTCHSIVTTQLQINTSANLNHTSKTISMYSHGRRQIFDTDLVYQISVKVSM